VSAQLSRERRKMSNGALYTEFTSLLQSKQELIDLIDAAKRVNAGLRMEISRAQTALHFGPGGAMFR
jgi:hypothetical protein